MSLIGGPLTGGLASATSVDKGGGGFLGAGAAAPWEWAWPIWGLGGGFTSGVGNAGRAAAGIMAGACCRGAPYSASSFSIKLGLLRIFMSKSRSMRLPSSLLLINAVKAADAAATTSGSTPGGKANTGFPPLGMAETPDSAVSAGRLGKGGISIITLSFTSECCCTNMEVSSAACWSSSSVGSSSMAVTGISGVWASSWCRSCDSDAVGLDEGPIK